MHLVVAMAGLGERFAREGYLAPKPLIPVCGVPMVVRVVRSLPETQKKTFLVHPDHVREFAIDRSLLRWFPGSRVVTTPGLTQGQACTVRLASCEVSPHEEVLVAACDASHIYDRAAFESVRRNSSIDAAIWTFRNDPRVLLSPKSYGWVDAEPNGLVRRVSCKVPLSQTPIGDHVISGFFWFRKAADLFQSVDRLVASNERVNNEFYLDQAPNLLIRDGKRVVVFETKKYIGWGTPSDLRDYETWENHFRERRSSFANAA